MTQPPVWAMIFNGFGIDPSPACMESNPTPAMARA